MTLRASSRKDERKRTTVEAIEVGLYDVETGGRRTFGQLGDVTQEVLLGHLAVRWRELDIRRQFTMMDLSHANGSLTWNR